MDVRTALRKKAEHAKSKKGFTLVELVIVIAVLAIIAFIAIPTVSNVIGNANSAADNSNAQAIETAIKSAQSECAANQTIPSARAATVIKDTDKLLTTLLSSYGVAADVLTSPKVSGDLYYIDSVSGKVVARASDPKGNYKVLNATTSKYTATDGSDVATTDGTKAAKITIVP